MKDEPVVLPDLEEGLESKAKEAVVREKPPLEEFVEPEVTVITRWVFVVCVVPSWAEPDRP